MSQLGKDAADALIREFRSLISFHFVGDERINALSNISALICLEKQLQTYDACQKPLPILEESIKAQIEYLKSLS